MTHQAIARPRLRPVLAGLFAAGVVLFAGCTGAGPDQTDLAGNARDIAVIGSDRMAFEPAMIVVGVGEPVRVAFENNGFLFHDFTLESADGKFGQVRAFAIGNGKTRTLVFSFDQPGSYVFYCAQPLHRSRGMAGVIVVE